MMCEKCTKLMGLTLLILGILFLLVDLAVWKFWGINWWTAVLLLMGLAKLCSGSCPACKAKIKKKK